MVHTDAVLCQLSTYLFVLWIPKLLQVHTNMNLVCTWYVLGTYWYVHRKTKKQRGIMSGIKPRISCIASCMLYHSVALTTSVHSMVISMVNTRYIFTETYTCIAQYILAGVGHLVRVQQRPLLLPWCHWSGYQLEFPGCPCWLCKRQTLKAQVSCETLLSSGVQAGTDFRPSSCCAAQSDWT